MHGSPSLGDIVDVGQVKLVRPCGVWLASSVFLDELILAVDSRSGEKRNADTAN